MYMLGNSTQLIIVNNMIIVNFHLKRHVIIILRVSALEYQTGRVGPSSYKCLLLMVICLLQAELRIFIFPSDMDFEIYLLVIA